VEHVASNKGISSAKPIKESAVSCFAHGSFRYLTGAIEIRHILCLISMLVVLAWQEDG